MNVRELIAELQTVDPELPVYVFNNEDGWADVVRASVISEDRLGTVLCVDTGLYVIEQAEDNS